MYKKKYCVSSKARIPFIVVRCSHCERQVGTKQGKSKIHLQFPRVNPNVSEPLKITVLSLSDFFSVECQGQK